MYMVVGDQTPRFAYTIGLHETLGHEYIIAGCAFYREAELADVINTVAKNALKSHSSPTTSKPVAEFGKFGSFSVRDVHESWARKLALGAFDHYENQAIRFFQIIPDKEHHTIDVPDMEQPWGNDPVWQWMDSSWPDEIPESATVIADLGALQGYYITECTRWESDEWEMFAADAQELQQEDMRRIPLGILLGTDPTIAEVLMLEVGVLAYRSYEEQIWHRHKLK
jgi:hypothetical protein